MELVRDELCDWDVVCGACNQGKLWAGAGVGLGDDC